MAINFPNNPSTGNTYDYNGVRYTYQAGGYWAITTPGTVGVASGAEVIGGLDNVKYATPKAMEDSDYWNARNQGAGSGLDADTIDGEHLSALVQKDSAATTTVTHKIENSAPRITYSETDASVGNRVWSVGVNNEFFRVDTRDDLEAFIESIVTLDRAGELKLGGNLVWTAGNDGAGSGLDADTVDGVHANELSLVGTFKGFNVNGKHDAYSGDLNNLIDNSIYVFDKLNVTNEPANLPSWGFIHTLQYSGASSYGTQVCYSMDSGVGDSYIRHRNAGVWSAWYENFSTGNCPNSLAENGYQKLASGLIIQWGYTSALVGTTRTITFPIAFPSVCRSVQIQSTLASSNYVHTANTVTNGNFTMQNYGITADYYWMAIGY